MPRGRKPSAKLAKTAKTALETTEFDLELTELDARTASMLAEKPIKKSTKNTKSKTKSTKATKKTAKKTDKKTTEETLTVTPEANKKSETKLKSTYDVNSIKTFAELMDAVTVKETKITLGDNIITESNIMINHDLEIDFNGFSIVSEEPKVNVRVLDIRSGKVTLSGYGKVFAMGERGVAVRVFGAISVGVPDYTSLTIGENISLYAPDAYAILVSPNLGVAYGVVVDFAGKIMAHDGICVASGIHGQTGNAPSIKIRSSASIIADETNGTALEASGFGDWKIGAAKIHGAVGACLRTGNLSFSDTQLFAHSNATFRVEDGAENSLKVEVDGGTYLSETAAIADGTAHPLKDFAFKNCELYSPVDDTIATELEPIVEIKNCEFETDIEGCLENLIMMETEHVEKEVESSEKVDKEVTEVAEETLIPETKNEEVAAPAEVEDELLSEDDFVDELFEMSDDELDEDWFAELSEAEELKSAPKFSKLATVESSKTTKKNAQAVSKTAPKVEPVLPFAAKIDSIPELTDAETDEHEILLALNAEDMEAEIAAPPLAAEVASAPAIHPPVPPDLDEQEAARMALADAIAEIRKLSAEDYDKGYTGLEQAIRKAEATLAQPFADLTAIRDAAGILLQAFDQLEEHDDSGLSDAELDELFYQGAVLEEMIRPQKPVKTPKNQNNIPVSNPTTMANSNSALVQTEIAKTASGARKVQIAKIPNVHEPDFTILSDALTTISAIDLSKYTAASQAALLEELDLAQSVLTNLQSTQAEIDEVAANLLAGMSRLEMQTAKHAANITGIKTSAPVPVVTAIVPAAMIDELAPVGIWSSGVTMIDELEPFVMTASTQEKILRAMQPRFKVFINLILSPFRKLGRSLSAGIRAGFRAYQETLHAQKV